MGATAVLTYVTLAVKVLGRLSLYSYYYSLLSVLFKQDTSTFESRRSWEDFCKFNSSGSCEEWLWEMVVPTAKFPGF
jgi:hypothetical protein